MSRLFLLFIIVPIIELMLLIKVGEVVGFWPTIGVIVLTGMLGSYMAKREGFSALARFQEALGEGGFPGKELVDGIIILVAGVLLITPGVMTDFLGLIGLFPLTRAIFRETLVAWFTKQIRTGNVNFSSHAQPNGFGHVPVQENTAAQDFHSEKKAPRSAGGNDIEDASFTDI